MTSKTDLNLSLEVSEQNENWTVSCRARNLFEMWPTLFQDLKISGDGMVSSSGGVQLGNSATTS